MRVVNHRLADDDDCLQERALRFVREVGETLPGPVADGAQTLAHELLMAGAAVDHIEAPRRVHASVHRPALLIRAFGVDPRPRRLVGGSPVRVEFLNLSKRIVSLVQPAALQFGVRQLVAPLVPLLDPSVGGHLTHCPADDQLAGEDLNGLFGKRAGGRVGPAEDDGETLRLHV